MKITETAKMLHTTPRTIRFYEEKGLITPEKGENDYRYFQEEDLWKLQTILALREVGMSTAQIKASLEGDNIQSYLDLQRSALYGEWIQIKDMITTLDQMIGESPGHEDLLNLSQQLKEVKKMRKSWKDRWNFDEQAEEYDQTIKTTGYRFNVHEHYHVALSKVKDWVEPKPEELGVDIGTGTGNLAALFMDDGTTMIGVDQSEEMLKVCLKKYPELETRPGHFLSLPIMDHSTDFVVSSYALHHLQDAEKELALAEMDRILNDDGRIAIADLMFENEKEKQRILAQFEQEGNGEAVDAIHDEFYADLSKLVNWLEKEGYNVKTHQFNRILHLLYAEK
ncbi:MerR family transcriptional regulator [Halobacillus litoralis]|uniref:MerR family transcriptional regulator n=1 Tax=Halobacillus litoralis TaxID=45668 RepID=UPI0024916CAF|nr:MerR family transcriptional regulator [Halobacillus litoralis]